MKIQQPRNVLATLLVLTSMAAATQVAHADTGREGVDTLHGLRIYNKVCSTCHEEGKNGAPRLDDTSDWKRRIFQGEEVLDHHALNGYLKMPAKGGHQELSKQDIIDAVHFIIVMIRDEPTR